MEYLVQARNKRTKEFIEAILPSMIKQLKLTNSKKALFVKVSKSDIEGDNMGQTAYIHAVDGIVVIINPQSREKMGLTLAHEMVHVKQIAKGQYSGRLAPNGKVLACWRGKPVKAAYLKRPWEVEAYNRQNALAEMMIESIDKLSNRSKK